MVRQNYRNVLQFLKQVIPVPCNLNCKFDITRLVVTHNVYNKYIGKCAVSNCTDVSPECEVL